MAEHIRRTRAYTVEPKRLIKRQRELRSGTDQSEIQSKTATRFERRNALRCDPGGLSPRIAQVASRRLMAAARRLLKGLYLRADAGTLTTAQRNYLIQIRYADGESRSELAQEFGITPQRVWQIVTGT